MGGIKAYHDVFDIGQTLPLNGYNGVFKLLTGFVKGLVK
jgi:aminopeptidase YwaD